MCITSNKIPPHLLPDDTKFLFYLYKKITLRNIIHHLHKYIKVLFIKYLNWAIINSLDNTVKKLFSFIGFIEKHLKIEFLDLLFFFQYFVILLFYNGC